MNNPSFDDNGNWYLPTDIKFGGKMKPKLKPREWLLYQALKSKNLPSWFLKEVVGSRATIYRLKASLRKKGYL